MTVASRERFGTRERPRVGSGKLLLRCLVCRIVYISCKIGRVPAKQEIPYWRILRMYRSRLALWASVAAAVSFSLPLSATAQTPGPEPAPMPPPVVAPRDIPFPGTIHLQADLTNTIDRVMTVHETIPVRPGKMVLLYPQWIPGEHAPEGPIDRFAGLMIRGNGSRIPWVRDRVNMYAFHIDVPQGVSTLDVRFDYLSPVQPDDGRVEVSNVMADLSWNCVVLYPAGYFSRDIHIVPSVVLPAGWQYGTALSTVSKDGNTIHFKETTLNTLVDSPMIAGLHFERVNLSTGPDNIVHLDVVADQEKDLKITPAVLQDHKNLTIQAQKLFASHHYNHYDFLLILSDVLGGQGLEHHRSSEDATGANYFTDWAAQVPEDDLLAHEYTHSWNGKFRRPNDLWTPNFNVPMRNDLLWVYEGLTQYWGYVLTARSGLRSPQDTRDLIAAIAAGYEIDPGREWRPLIDTTNQEILSERRPVSWVSWQREEDYYDEGLLIWLDIDTKIRELSHGQKSLDNFAKEFYGIHNGSFVTVTYDFNDIVNGLNKVQPYNWASFLRDRIYKLHPAVPLGGITQGGYKLVYNDKVPAWQKNNVLSRYGASFGTSLGFAAMPDGEIVRVWWGSLAFKAGLTRGMKIVAVDGNVYSTAKMREVILQAEKSTSPIAFVVKENKLVKTVQINYHGGLRVPHLERVKGTPDRLDAILAPVK